jgi:hypothetical protein
MNLMQHSADSKLEARLDNNDYNEASLIELKVPLDLPYQNDWKEFERYDGEITVDGQHYKYVKRKVQDGMMVLKCIPNESKQQIESAKDHFFRFANDLQNNPREKKSDSSKPSMAKNNITECEEFSYLTLSLINYTTISKKINGNNSFLVTRPHSSPEQPPEA